MTSTLSTIEEGRIKPSDLRHWDGGQLYVRNNANFKIVHDDNRGGELVLGHKGSGLETAVLPLDVAKHPGFQKMWRRGHVTVSTDPAMEDELFLMELRAEELARQKADELAGRMEDNPADKDIVQTKCAHCDVTIFVPEIQVKRGEIPPLCTEHEEMAALFSLTFEKDEEGHDVPRWVAQKVEPLVKGEPVTSRDPKPTRVGVRKVTP